MHLDVVLSDYEPHVGSCPLGDSKSPKPSQAQALPPLPLAVVVVVVAFQFHPEPTACPLQRGYILRPSLKMRGG